MQQRSETKHIIVHCSATKPSMDIGVVEITDWHVNERDFSDIGYHFVIRRNGVIETGREEAFIGAHAIGYNRTSIGICLVGGLSENGKHDEFNFEDVQMSSLRLLIDKLNSKYGGLTVLGHNEVTDAKSCPTFNVPAWLAFGDIVLASGAQLAK